MSIITILIILSSYLCPAHSSNSKINKLRSELDIKNPNFIISLSNEGKHLLKDIFDQDNYMKALGINEVNVENKNIVMINYQEIGPQATQQFLNQNVFHKMLIINPYDIISHEELSMNIDQEVYFFDETSEEVFEAYEINNMKIKRNLGHYNTKNNSFHWNSNKYQTIFRRRANFHGLTLKAIVEPFPPSVFVDNNYKENARFIKSNQTYLLNGFVKGVNIDILEHLQDRLNFSTDLYKRQVKSYGYVKDWKNGTITGVGMISDIYFKRADMIISGIMMLESRLSHMDYLRPLVHNTWGLYISKNAVHDAMEYDNYFKAFELQTWSTIFFFITLIGIIKLLVFTFVGEIKKNYSFPLVGMKLVWCAMKSIFGGKVSNPDIDFGITQNFILFIWSLCGSVIWIYYRSQITALLSISGINKPFYDLESMTNTNWR